MEDEVCYHRLLLREVEDINRNTKRTQPNINTQKNEFMKETTANRNELDKRDKSR